MNLVLWLSYLIMLFSISNSSFTSVYPSFALVILYSYLFGFSSSFVSSSRLSLLVVTTLFPFLSFSSSQPVFVIIIFHNFFCDGHNFERIFFSSFIFLLVTTILGSLFFQFFCFFFVIALSIALMLLPPLSMPWSS